MNKRELIDIHNLTIRFSDTDAMGVVWHGNYLRYFEDGRESFGMKFGLDYMLIKNNDLFAPVVNLNCAFKKPLHYGQNAQIHTKFIDSDAAKILLEYEIKDSKTDELIATGESIQVFTNLNYELILSPPQFLIDWKKSVFGDLVE